VFFANPTRAIGKSLPPAKYWEYEEPDRLWRWIRRYRWRRAVRASLAQKIVLKIATQIEGKKLSSAVNTDAVFQDFFAPIVRVSQRTFTSVFFLSWAAFLAGLALIASGVVIAIRHPSSGDATVTASVFGGSGAISALGSVYALATQGIREAALDHARLRAVLTAFATQLGQLRAVAERPVEELRQAPVDLKPYKDLNVAITEAMVAALQAMPSSAEAAAAKANRGQSSSNARPSDTAPPKPEPAAKATAPKRAFRRLKRRRPQIKP
jgi:hypothetical protein